MDQTAVLSATPVVVSSKSKIRPAKGFKPAPSGRLASKLHLHDPQWLAGMRKRVRGAKYQGNLFDKKVGKVLAELSPWYSDHPWFTFLDSGVGRNLRWCQPDGLFVNFHLGHICIVEAKLTFTWDAYWELFHLYLPVVKDFFGPQWTYSCLNIVRTINPGSLLSDGETVPNPVNVLSSRLVAPKLPGTTLRFPSRSFNVMPWNEADLRKGASLLRKGTGLV